SGFFVDGNARAIVELRGANGIPLILVSQQADSLKVFQNTQRMNRHTVALKSLDQKAEIFLKDDRTLIKEFSYGGSYLGQSSRFFFLNDDVDSIAIFDYAGN